MASAIKYWRQRVEGHNLQSTRVHRLHVDNDSEVEQRLRSAISDLLVETPEGLMIKGSKPMRLGVLTWTP